MARNGKYKPTAKNKSSVGPQQSTETAKGTELTSKSIGLVSIHSKAERLNGELLHQFV